MADAIPAETFFDLRCITDSCSVTDLPTVADALRALIVPYTSITDQFTEPYDKFPGSHELYFDLEVPQDSRRIYAAIRDRLGTGWGEETVNEGPGWHGASVVWNRGAGASFADPTIRWAHLWYQGTESDL